MQIASKSTIGKGYQKDYGDGISIDYKAPGQDFQKWLVMQSASILGCPVLRL